MHRPAALLPSLALEVQGRRCWVDDIAPDVSVGDLVVALAHDAPIVTDGAIAIDGRTVDLHMPLARSGIRQGSRIGAADPVLATFAGGSAACGPGVVVATWVCGPDAGGATTLLAWTCDGRRHSYTVQVSPNFEP